MVTRDYYYSCDIGPHGRGRLRQQKLSFRKTTPEDNPVVEDSGPGEKNFDDFDTTPSVGK